MITLHFTEPNGDKYFEIFYEGFMVGGSLERNKGLPVLRREIRILDKIEQISEPFPCGKLLPVNDEPCRKLIDINQELTLERAELELVLKYLTIVPWTTGKSVRNAIEVIDWINGALVQNVSIQ